MRPLRSFLLLSLLGMFVCAFQTAAGQTKLDSCAAIKQTENFLALADRRGELMAESQDLRDEIGKLEKFPDVVTVAEFDKLKKDADDLEKKASRTPLEEQTMLNLQNRLKDVKTDESIKRDLDDKRKSLDQNKELLLCVQEAISQLASPDKKFRSDISFYYAALIALVILGFFVLAFRDGTMRRAIFSGETGIQFLTLFSLVIAIILFGITGILESKELSALLGGLSGFILGRGVRPPAGQSQTPSGAGTAALAQFIKTLNEISVMPAAAALSATNKTMQLVATPKDAAGATINDPDGFFVPTWESSDTKVAKVNDAGMVSMVAAGTCNITASFANVTSNSCQITVT